MTAVSYRTFTGTGAENYQRYFVPAIADARLRRPAPHRRGCSPANGSSTSPAVPG